MGKVSIIIMFFSLSESIALVSCTQNIWDWETVNKKDLLYSTKRQNQLTALNPVESLWHLSKAVTDQLNQLEG